MENQNWNRVYKSITADSAYTEFHQTLTSLFDTSFPLKRKNSKKNKKRPTSKNPQLVRLKEQIITLSELATEYPNNRNIRNQLNEKKDNYKLSLLETKKNETKSKIESSDNKTREIWKIVNHETTAAKKSSEITIYKNDEPIDPEETCEIFNDYFLSVPNLVIRELERGLNDNLPNSQVTEILNPETIYLSPITEEETLQCINKLKDKPSSGYDNISSILIKKVKFHLVKPLTFLINKSFEEGIFPNELKIAKVVPIHKDGDNSDIQNYRPISIIPTISKIFEYAILTRLVNFFTKHKILSKNQFGFTKKRSTIDAVITVIEQIIDALERGEVSMAHFLDLSKAFDCVDRGLLLQTLYRYGVRGVAQSLIASYLTNRPQYVSVKGSQSRLRETQHGVPQGSILGPFLFIVYTNDLISDNIMYADDTTSLYSDNNLINLEIIGNTGINELTQNFASLKLMVNPKKTASVIFKPARKVLPFEPTVQIEENVIENSNHFKLLGINIDENLTWTDHIEDLAAKVSSGLFAIRRIVQIANIEASLSVYYALIESHLRYGIVLWGSCSIENRNRIFKLQKRAIRYICGVSSDTHCKEYFIKLKVLSLPSLYILEACLLAKKNLNVLTKVGDKHSYNTRFRNILLTQQHHTTRFEKKPSYKGTKFYNKLPGYIREAATFNIFKNQLKKFLLEKCFYSASEFLES